MQTDNSNFKRKFSAGNVSIELTTRRLPVKTQLKLKFQLIQMFAEIGGALGSLIPDESAEDISTDVNVDRILALTTSIKTLDADEFIELLVTLCEYTNEVGKNKGAVIYDFVFDEKPMMLTYKVALWVLEVNFKDFISGSGLLTMFKKLGDKIVTTG